MGNENLVSGIRSMKEFYEGFGLKDYPFNVYTAENESQYANEIFVHPLNYDAIKSSYDSNRSIVIRGNRGTGKTALLNDLLTNTDPKTCIQCVIDDYSDLDINPQNSEYYHLIITNLVTKLFYRLFDDKKRLNNLNKEDKLFLSYLLSEFTSVITKNELTRKIESIQLSGFAKFIKKNVNFFRVIFNYGINAGLNILNDVIRNYYGALPPVQATQIREIIPKLSFETDTEFNKERVSYNMLLRICTVIGKLGYTKIVVFFDKFDEDNRMENNAETISQFITPLITDNKLLENPSIQIIVSVWEVAFSRILDQFRSQKHHCPLLSWPVPKLKDALNKRLHVFSDGGVDDFSKLLDSDVDEATVNEVFTLCNGNPRDLWHIFDHIFQSQYGLDPQYDKLAKRAVDDGLKRFVTEFNFFEYYPKKPNAKANTMDVYSYIKHLLKLESDVFTKNQLNDMAKTGGSTNNYVVGMEKIGLIINTNEKEKGGVLYRINDPKVVYAMRNGLDISKP